MDNRRTSPVGNRSRTTSTGGGNSPSRDHSRAGRQIGALGKTPLMGSLARRNQSLNGSNQNPDTTKVAGEATVTSTPRAPKRSKVCHPTPQATIMTKKQGEIFQSFTPKMRNIFKNIEVEQEEQERTYTKREKERDDSKTEDEEKKTWRGIRRCPTQPRTTRARTQETDINLTSPSLRKREGRFKQTKDKNGNKKEQTKM